MNSRTNQLLYFIIVGMALVNTPACDDTSLEESSLAELKHVLHNQPEFIKVHAAEFLVWLGHKDEVREVFLRENDLHGSQPKYRIGIWRVLAQTETDSAKKHQWHNKNKRDKNDNVFQEQGLKNIGTS